MNRSELPRFEGIIRRESACQATDCGEPIVWYVPRIWLERRYATDADMAERMAYAVRRRIVLCGACTRDHFLTAPRRRWQ